MFAFISFRARIWYKIISNNSSRNSYAILLHVFSIVAKIKYTNFSISFKIGIIDSFIDSFCLHKNRRQFLQDFGMKWFCKYVVCSYKKWTLVFTYIFAQFFLKWSNWVLNFSLKSFNCDFSKEEKYGLEWIIIE